jgi:uncharacterized protein (TIGR02246 family)
MTQSGSSIHAEIAAANEAFMAAAGRGDAAGLAALYTANGQLLPPNADFVTGPEALQGFWQAVLDMGIQKAELNTVEVEGFGETAVEVGKFKLFGAEDQLLDQGKYIVYWKQQEGQWKLHRDIFNSSMPAPG